MQDAIRPLDPDKTWLNSYLSGSLQESRAYSIDTPHVSIKLDQNENPSDWPASIKQQVLTELAKMAWNRYPAPYTDDLTELVAHYAGVPAASCLLGTGSNYLLTIIFNTFARHRQGRLLLARPSFALYESHCRAENIAYEPWCLTDDLEYDLTALQNLPKGSMVVFASPNNPPGNSLSYQDFDNLLQANPSTLFVADEAYFEYIDQPYTPLLNEYANLMIVRTFSKTMSLAGLRVGYVLASPFYIDALKKLRLPFMLNHFSHAALRVVLTDPLCQEHLKQTVDIAKSERAKVYAAMQEMSATKHFSVKPSEANFLLARWHDHAGMAQAYQHLVANDILVRDVSRGPGLANCLRISIGTESENAALIRALAQIPQ